MTILYSGIVVPMTAQFVLPLTALCQQIHEKKFKF